MNRKLSLTATLLVFPLFFTTLFAGAAQNDSIDAPVDIEQVLLFDDFNNAGLNSAVWGLNGGQYQISNSILTISSSNFSAILEAKQGYSNREHVLEIRVKVDSKTGIDSEWGMWPWGNTEMGPSFSYADGVLTACSAYSAYFPHYDCATISSFDATEWHLYTIAMQDTNARLYIDGNLVHTGTTYDCDAYFAGECHIMASIRPTSTSARSIDIDYIRYSIGTVGPLACYTLTTGVSPAGGGSIQASPAPNCTGNKYTAGTQVSLTANPATGYGFANWSGALAGSQNPALLTMNSDKTVTANFSQQCYTLTTNVTPAGSGSVLVSPGPNCADGKYTAGTNVELKGLPYVDFQFYRWTGDISGSVNPITVALNGNKSVTAEFVTTGDPYFLQQWGLEKIDIIPAWAITQGSEDVIIAVIDTGVEYFHVDLGNGKTLTENDKDFINNDDDARDDNGHGTHVAGIVAAHAANGFGIAGVCPLCRILPVKALDAGGSGSYSAVAQAIQYAADEGAAVINLSLGGEACTNELAEAVNYAYDRGVVLIAAAGNACAVKVALGLESFDVNYPAQFGRVISVGATDQNDNRADFSSYGPALDLSAPGEDILSTYLNESYKELDGTSMAAPHVAGVAGLLLAHDGSYSPAQVQSILERSAIDIGVPGRDDKTGWGRLDAARALTTPPVPVTSAPPAVCPAPRNDEIPRTEDLDLLDLYTRIRDEVFSTSYAGQNFTGLYYEYGPTLAAILLTQPDLLGRTTDFLRNAEEEFGSLLPDSTETITLSQELYNEADALVQDLANAGDEAFRNTILAVWEDLDLDSFIGEETTLIWEEIQQIELYLPIINR